ncbi:MAG: hypothetical protein WC389_13910 [Lutibacter sp.]|jgi:predicted ArsR family transcriptional regulator
MSEVYDNAIEKIGKRFFIEDRQDRYIPDAIDKMWNDMDNETKLHWLNKARKLLNYVPELAIVDRNFSGEHSTTHCEMLKQGFVKEVKE